MTDAGTDKAPWLSLSVRLDRGGETRWWNCVASTTGGDGCSPGKPASRATRRADPTEPLVRGDGIDERSLQKFMWTWKPHYYSSGLSFYNYPYAFGLLFATGLYAIYQQRGEANKGRST